MTHKYVDWYHVMMNGHTFSAVASGYGHLNISLRQETDTIMQVLFDLHSLAAQHLFIHNDIKSSLMLLFMKIFLHLSNDIISSLLNTYTIVHGFEINCMFFCEGPIHVEDHARYFCPALPGRRAGAGACHSTRDNVEEGD